MRVARSWGGGLLLLASDSPAGRGKPEVRRTRSAQFGGRTMRCEMADASPLAPPLTCLPASSPRERQGNRILTFLSCRALRTPWGHIMAASVVVTVPLVVLVLIFQRRIISGLTAGGVKG